jgi:hypothetical protein
MFTLALSLQLLAGVAPIGGPPAKHDSSTSAMIARARRVETDFLMTWHETWEDRLAANSSYLRLVALHCHADASWGGSAPPHLITTPFSRKSMCPIWVPTDEQAPPDEAIWIDNSLPPQDQKKIGAGRAIVLRLLDSAAAAAPGDSWITGQRVRLYVDQRQFDRATAIAHDDCALAPSYCAMLSGFVLESSGDVKGANAAYAYAESLMTEQERCAYLDIRPFISAKELAVYGTKSCAERDKLNARFWWLSDPLYSDEWNERLAIQLYRQTLILLHSALTVDERFDWRVQFGAGATAEMILRYGWPSFAYWDRWEDNEHYKWLGFNDSSSNSSLEYLLPRYHSTPSFASVLNPGSIDSAAIAPKWNARRGKWNDDWWPVEHFARAAPLVALDYQVTLLRRATGVMVAFATRPDPDLLPDSVLSRYAEKLVAMNDPTDTARRSVAPARFGPAGSIVDSLMTTPGHQIIAGEIVSTDNPNATAGRARFVVTAPPTLGSLAPGQLAVSEPLFFQPGPNDGALPASAEDAMSRMLGSLTFTQGRVGVFWELYGLVPRDTVDITLTVTSLDRPGILHRIGESLGILGEDGGTVAIKWREPEPGARSAVSYTGAVPIQAHAVALDVSRLRAGRYSVEVSAARPREAPVSSVKDVRVKR